MKNILIFIPAYNVEKKIYSVIERIPIKIFENKIKILIINDNSKDKTEIEINRIINDFNYDFELIKNSKQLGYGGTQKLAFNFAIENNFNYMVMIHGDGQYAPEELPNFIKQYEDDDSLDAVFGSRMISYKNAIKGGMPIYKFLGNIFLTFIQNLILRSKISEFHSGYRSFKVDSLKKLNYKDKANYYHFDTEIIIEILKNNLKLKEIKIPTHYGDEVSHLKSIPYGINVLYTTIKSKLKNNK